MLYFDDGGARSEAQRAAGVYLALVKGQSDRCAMSFEEHVGRDGFRHEVRALAGHARIGVRAKIGIWPAVKPSFLDGSQIIRDEFIAEIVSFIDCRPQFSGRGIPR